MAKKTAEKMLIEIPELKESTILVRLVGLPGSPLVCCPFDEKAKSEIRDKQGGAAKARKGAKDREGEFNRHRYIMEDGSDGFPVILIKHALTDACSFASNVTKVHVRGAIYVENPTGSGEWLAKITLPPGRNGATVAASDWPKMREDRVMVNGMGGRGTGKADLRYRPEYNPWCIEVALTFDSTIFQPGAVFNLVRIAGRRIGIGEWRPQKGGIWGRFDVEAVDNEETGNGTDNGVVAREAAE